MLAEEYTLTEPTQREIITPLSALTKQTLYLGRILSLLSGNAGSKDALVFEPINMAVLTDEVVATFNPQTLDRTLITHYPPEPPYVRGDAGHLYVVLDNLVSNAVKYSKPQSSITISIDHIEGQIGEDNGYLFISVMNDGSFIPPEEQEKIFNKFYRSPNSDQPGFGLGLYFVKCLIKIHDGLLGVESSAEGSTTFWFTLPRVESAPSKSYLE